MNADFELPLPGTLHQKQATLEASAKTALFEKKKPTRKQIAGLTLRPAWARQRLHRTNARTGGNTAVYMTAILEAVLKDVAFKGLNQTAEEDRHMLLDEHIADGVIGDLALRKIFPGRFIIAHRAGRVVHKKKPAEPVPTSA